MSFDWIGINVYNFHACKVQGNAYLHRPKPSDIPQLTTHSHGLEDKIVGFEL